MAQWLGAAWADVRYAFRGWRREPIFVAVAVLSLAAGIGLNTAVFSVINTIFLQSIRGVPEPARVATIGTRVPFTTFREIRDNARAMDGVAAWQPVGVTLRYRDQAFRHVVPAVSDTYFTVLGLHPHRGRFFDQAAAAARTPSPAAEVVLDFEYWRDVLAGDPQAVGQTIAVNETPATIVGVAPRAFHGFGPERPPLWMSMGMLPAARGSAPAWENAGETGWRVFGRVGAGQTVDAVNAELRALAAAAPGVFPREPLRAGTGPEQFTGEISAEKRIEFLLVVVLPLVVVALMLWIGCSNVANLLLARAGARRKEIAIRMANGAGRLRVLRLLLTESLLLALAGGAAGLLLAVWCRDLLWAMLPEAPRLAVELDAHVLVYTAAVSVAATVLFGLAPALHATRVDVAPLLKGDESGAGSARRGGRIRTFFLVTQFAASAALLITAGTFVRTIVSTHLGGQAALLDRLSLASIDTKADSPAARAEYWRRVRQRLHEVPGVTALTIMPAGAERTARLAPEGVPLDEHVTVRVQAVDTGFFPTSDVTLIRGADLAADGAESTGALLNERAARQMRLDASIVGHRLRLDGSTTISVAGIVRDDGAEARIYQRLRDGDVGRANVLVRTTQPAAAAIDAIRAAALQLGADRATTRVSTLRDASTGMLQRLTGIALAVAGLALALAVVGLYGSVAFITAQRTREIAIRMAVGAPRSAVVRMLLWQGSRVVSAGCAAGLALTAVAFQFMSGMIFARWTLDPWTIAGVMVVFSAATLAACYLPGRRATRIDPISVLRAQ